MKKALPLLLIILISSKVLDAQLINWARNTEAPPGRFWITTDRASNLYTYGYTETWRPSEHEVSVIKKYSPDGQLIFSRQWKDKVFISSLLNDGKGSFYFCGFFRDTVNEQGISLTSNGHADGFFGKMDEEGTVAWTIGFGGAGNDRAQDLCFNADSSEIVLTGGVESTVFMYGYEQFTTEEAIFVARFDLSGGMQSYRTYAYTPDEYGRNTGREIRSNGSGGYYLLASRMGDHWSNEQNPSGSPMEGEYVFSLDTSLQIRWSRYIISSSCYYGHFCEGLGILAGEACIPSFCSGKYGGTGRLQRLEASSGNTGWSVTNEDGYYYDTHTTSSGLLYVGNEEANGCPCEDNNPGYARIKLVDDSSGDRVLFSKYGFHFYRVVQAPNGSIYVFGDAFEGDPHLQGRPLERGYILFSMQGPPASFDLRLPQQGLLSVYPNPSSDYVEIVNGQMIEELTVLNGSGAIITQVRPDAKSWTLNDLMPGYYLVRIKDVNGYHSSKVLVGSR
jgi:hypothetical protein